MDERVEAAANDALAIKDTSEGKHNDTDEAPGLASRFSKGFSGNLSTSFARFSTATSDSISRRLDQRAAEAKDERKMRLKAAKDQAAGRGGHAAELVREMGGHEWYDKERLPAAGEYAYMRNLEASNLANVGSIQKVGLGTTQMSPITKMSPEKMRQEMELRAAKQAEQEAQEAAQEAHNLVQWFDAGLTRDAEGNLHGRKPLPKKYTVATWASTKVPLIHHDKTGVVTWPVRFDLIPLYEHVEAVSHKQSAALRGRSTTTTVYHYTNKAAFHKIVAPPEYVNPYEIYAEQHELGEEIWDRVADDLFRRHVQEIEGVSEYSLPLIALPPCKFSDRDAVACATYRVVNGKHHHMAVGYCIALQVPVDKVLAVPDENAEHTALVLAPGEDPPDEHDPDHKYTGKRAAKLVKWSMKAAFKKKHADKTAAEKVKDMELLHGLVDRDLVREKDLRERRDTEASDVRDSKTAKPKVGNTDEDLDRLENLELQLKDQREKLQHKIQHAEHAQEKAEIGKEVRFLETDHCRMKKLRRMLAKVEQDEEDTKTQLRDLRTELEITLDAGTQVAEGDEGEQRRMRRRRKNVDGHTAFGEEVANFVNEVGDEYQRLAGKVFREVFGGDKQGVEGYLDAKGDPNALDQSSGWTPLHMATSKGDLEIIQLLMTAHAIPTVRSRDHGVVPMHLAVRKPSMAVLEELLKSGARAVREKSNDGSTPLMTCITASPLQVKNKMMVMMLEAHADANLERNDGWSPMSWAVKYGMKVPCKVLVLHGGKVLNDMPETDKKLCIWQAAGKIPGLQDVMKEKLNSRDLQALEKKYPGTIKGKSKMRYGDDED